MATEEQCPSDMGANEPITRHASPTWVRFTDATRRHQRNGLPFSMAKMTACTSSLISEAKSSSANA